MAEQGNLKKIIGFILKFVLAGVIVWYMVSRDPREILDCFRQFDYLWLIPAMFFYFLHMVFCAERWRSIAKVLRVKLGIFEALSITMQAYFFSLVIPGGAIGGDVIKMGVISKRSPSGEKLEGAFTVLMDRIVGMIALFLLTLILLGPAAPLLMRISIPGIDLPPNLLKLAIFGLGLLCVVGISAAMAIFFHRILERIPPFGALIRYGDKLLHGQISRLTAATDQYAAEWKKLSVLTLLSILFVHLMTVVPVFFLLHGLKVEYSFFNVITAVTIGNIVGLLPFFPSGIGGRDVATITILAAGGIAASDAKTCQLMVTGIILFFNLAGGIFFLGDFSGRGKKETAELS